MILYLPVLDRIEKKYNANINKILNNLKLNKRKFHYQKEDDEKSIKKVVIKIKKWSD